MKLSVQQLLALIKNSKLNFAKTNITGDCPSCSESEFGIAISDNHQFGCFRGKCGFKGNIYTLLKFLGRLEEFRESDGYSRVEEERLLKKIVDTEIEKIEESVEVGLPVGFKRLSDHEYLRSRGFTDEDFIKYKVGYTNLETRFHQYIIFPVEYEGKNVGYVGRSLLAKSQIKSLNDLYKRQGINKKILRYRNSETNFSNLVYGLNEVDERTKIVLIVEGIFDKINVDRHFRSLGLDNEIVCVATFKCKISSNQHLLIKQKGINIKEWWVMYDSDVLKLILETGQYLSDRGENTFIVLNKYEEIDPGEMNLEQLQESLYGTISYEEFYQKSLIRKELK